MLAIKLLVINYIKFSIYSDNSKDELFTKCSNPIGLSYRTCSIMHYYM